MPPRSISTPLRFQPAAPARGSDSPAASPCWHSGLQCHRVRFLPASISTRSASKGRPHSVATLVGRIHSPCSRCGLQCCSASRSDQELLMRRSAVSAHRPHEPPMPDALAYFLTWPTYGTWLPGDERGWVKHGEGFQLPDPIRKREAAALM